MSFRPALLARLKAWAGLTSFAAAIRWTRSDAKDVGNRIVLRRISGSHARHLKGRTGLRQARVQIDCYGAVGNGGAEAAEAMAEAVLAALEAPGEFGGVRMVLGEATDPLDLSEQTANGYQHRQSVDAIIWHDG